MKRSAHRGEDGPRDGDRSGGKVVERAAGQWDHDLLLQMVDADDEQRKVHSDEESMHRIRQSPQETNLADRVIERGQKALGRG